MERLEAHLLDTARTVGGNAFDYFRTTIWEGLASQLSLYKAARLANPKTMSARRRTAAAVTADLHRVRELCDLEGCLAEYPRYLAFADGLPEPAEADRLTLEQMSQSGERTNSICRTGLHLRSV